MIIVNVTSENVFTAKRTYLKPETFISLLFLILSNKIKVKRVRNLDTQPTLKLTITSKI